MQLSSSSAMRDLSLFLLKNSLTSRMKRGLRNFCNSTTTLNQAPAAATAANLSCITIPTTDNDNSTTSPKTLEEMLLQLDMEEAAAVARRSSTSEYSGVVMNRRMSCVNNSDILRSARNALNQYPRFSLDGRDAMYRSSFRRRREVAERMPAMVGGERVVWCEAGVVAKLMGLESVPVPVNNVRRSKHDHEYRSWSSQNHEKESLREVRSRNLRRMGRCELERNRAGIKGRRCVTTKPPVAPEEGWEFRRRAR